MNLFVSVTAQGTETNIPAIKANYEFPKTEITHFDRNKLVKSILITKSPHVRNYQH
jgi:hypothetical protein